MCNSLEVEEPFPLADTVLSNVFFASDVEELFPEALAVLMFVWSITAESPAVAEPEP
jgi:hypothetical protein